MNKETLFDCISGSLYGLAIGDALGALTEGMNPDSISNKYGIITGFQSQDQVGTDDTEFTLFYIELLQKYGLNISSETIAKHWIEDIYHPSETYKGAGFSEVLTLRNLKCGLLPPESGQHVHSWSDGLAMCAAVFGCAYPGQAEKAADLASVFGRVSHHGEGIFGGRAVAAAVSGALSGDDWNAIYKSVLNSIPGDSWTYHSIQKSIKIGETSDDLQSAIKSLYDEIVCDYYYWSDLAPEAVGLSFGLMSASKGDFYKSVLGAVNLGRDADTVAAIAGAIIGAKIGYKKIPDDLKNRVDSVPGRCIRSMAGKKIIEAVESIFDIVVKGKEDQIV